MLVSVREEKNVEELVSVVWTVLVELTIICVVKVTEQGQLVSTVVVILLTLTPVLLVTKMGVKIRLLVEVVSIDNRLLVVTDWNVNTVRDMLVSVREEKNVEELV